MGEVGASAIVHYGSDVHLGEIIEVDRKQNEYRVVFFNSFRVGESYTFQYEKGKATSWVPEGGIYNIVRPLLPIPKGHFSLAKDDRGRGDVKEHVKYSNKAENELYLNGINIINVAFFKKFVYNFYK